MKKLILLTAGITGMLLGAPTAYAHVELCMSSPGHRPTFVIDVRPDFIELPDQGFSVSVGSPYDIITYDNWYYINQNGSWYRSSDYRGPWIDINENALPSNIRRHRLEEIRGYRDREYRNGENRRKMDQQRNDSINRRNLEQQRSDENNKRVLDQQRSDDNNKRALDQQRTDDNNRRLLEQQRSDANRNR